MSLRNKGKCFFISPTTSIKYLISSQAISKSYIILLSLSNVYAEDLSLHKTGRLFGGECLFIPP